MQEETDGQEDVFARYRESFSKMKGRFHILEQRVPVEYQAEYFKYSERIRREFGPEENLDLDYYAAILQDKTTSGLEKKRVLSILASSSRVEAYRIIEQYIGQPGQDFLDWAYMALMECRLTLESELSGERQIYVATGLGGKGSKLRFYVLLLSRGGKPFADYQKELMQKEFSYVMSCNDCEIERFTIEDRFAELVYLVPIKADIKSMLESAIRECNLYGNFLSKRLTITNAYELSREEVETIIEEWEDD